MSLTSKTSLIALLTTSFHHHCLSTSAKMSTILRTLRNIRKIGIRDYLHQMQYIGDTKAGTLIARDRYGNKYYENIDDELPLRTRWVDYKEKEYSPYAFTLTGGLQDLFDCQTENGSLGTRSSAEMMLEAVDY
ncbi:MAG: hypothetical protein Q9176_004235 [Flavoplaca citrina]